MRRSLIALMILAAFAALGAMPARAQGQDGLAVRLYEQNKPLRHGLIKLVVTDLDTGKTTELKRSRPGVWRAAALPVSVYSIKIVARCAGCPAALRRVEGLAYAATVNGQVARVSFNVNDLPPWHSRTSDYKGALGAFEGDCEGTAPGKIIQPVSRLRDAERRALGDLRRVWPRLRDRLTDKRNWGEARAKMANAAAIADPRARLKALLELRFQRGLSAGARGRVGRLIDLVRTELYHAAEIEDAKAALKTAKRLDTRNGFIGADYKSRTVSARNHTIGRPLHTHIKVKKGECLTIFVRKDQTWSAGRGAGFWMFNILGRVRFVGTKGLVARYMEDINGRLYGSLVNGRFTGHWAIGNSGGVCKKAMFGTRFWGTLSFTMTEDPPRATGVWRDCSGTNIRKLTGRRYGAAGPRRFNADGSKKMKPYRHRRATFPYGALVGRIGKDGPTFLVGTRYKAKAKRSGTLRLFFWGQQSDEHTGALRANIRVGS
jgi:hypothetical protein